MYRYELWRKHPPTLLMRWLTEGSVSWSPDPDDRPMGWPEGYEYRVHDPNGVEIVRRDVNPLTG